MIVNRFNLNTLYVAFSAAFAGALEQTQSQYAAVATTVPSSTKSNEYGWLGKIPGMREWLGDRVVHGLEQHGYAIRNKSFELTVGVDRDDIDDDNVGVYTPMFQEMGRASAAHPDELVFGLLGKGHETECYDGQPFFDTDHPVLDAKGDTIVQSNDLGGSGTPWFLLDASRAIRPIIFQQRKAPNFVSMDTETDEAVFTRKEFRYGVDARHNVGFGFWQMATRSQQTLDAAALQAGFTNITGRKGDYGRPLGLRPSVLVVPSSLEWKAVELLEAQRNAAGADNVMYKKCSLLVCPWL